LLVKIYDNFVFFIRNNPPLDLTRSNSTWCKIS